MPEKYWLVYYPHNDPVLARVMFADSAQPLTFEEKLDACEEAGRRSRVGNGAYTVVVMQAIRTVLPPVRG